MPSLSPYISFAGKTVEALDFYKSVFGGEANVTLAKDGPMAQQTPSDQQNNVFHADYDAGGFHILASDMMRDEHPPTNNIISLAVMCDSAGQLQTYFDALSKDGTVVWPVRDSEWGSIYAQVIDKFGMQWMLNYDKQAG